MKIVITIFSILLSSCSLADEKNIKHSSDATGFIGLSGIYRTTVFSVESSPRLGIVPNLFYSSNWGFIDSSLVSYNLLPYVSISANWRIAEVSNTFDDLPDGISDREGNPELGFTIGTPGARISYLHDVAGVHQGYEIRAYLARSIPTPLSGYKITPFIEIDWRDKKLSQHLYGISTQETADSGLNSYQSDATWVYKAGIVGLYDLSDKWQMFNKVRIESHDSDSDLVQRNLGWLAEIGLVYRL